MASFRSQIQLKNGFYYWIWAIDIFFIPFILNSLFLNVWKYSLHDSYDPLGRINVRYARYFPKFRKNLWIHIFEVSFANFVYWLYHINEILVYFMSLHNESNFVFLIGNKPNTTPNRSHANSWMIMTVQYLNISITQTNRHFSVIE